MTTVRTWRDLAAIIGVSPRRVTKWRSEYAATPTPCPSDRDPRAWWHWLRRTNRHRLADAMPLEPEPLQQSELDLGPATPPPPAAADELTTAAGEPLEKHHWDAIRAREQALKARRERELLERSLVPAAALQELAGDLGRCVVSELAGIAPALRAAQDGLSPSQRRAIEQALATALTTYRQQVARRARDLLRTHLTSEERTYGT